MHNYENTPEVCVICEKPQKVSKFTQQPRKTSTRSALIEVYLDVGDEGKSDGRPTLSESDGVGGGDHAPVPVAARVLPVGRIDDARELFDAMTNKGNQLVYVQSEIHVAVIYLDDAMLRSIAVVMRIVEEHLDAQRNREMAMAELGFLKATERGKDKEISCCNCFALKSHMFCEVCFSSYLVMLHSVCIIDDANCGSLIFYGFGMMGRRYL
ncbi:hypothetical protein EZV62_018865 [Acer yangbiense]|uniref:Uncharacterized protein n=1 Tax=Acer yangbiense TaxID=1000413 RepID=A0A5C7HA12_9ROSI|nr:hypothetical protein EZV62_018865 [Acer yangbiense]